jgi:hypothetical protein
LPTELIEFAQQFWLAISMAFGWIISWQAISASIAVIAVAMTGFVFHQESFESLKQWLVLGGFGTHYQSLLKWGLKKLTILFGHPFSARALVACYILAVGYSLVLLMGSWVFGATPSVNGLGILNVEITTLDRLGIALILTAVAGFLLAATTKYHSIQNWFLARLPKALSKSPLLIELAELIPLTVLMLIAGLSIRLANTVFQYQYQGALAVGAYIFVSWFLIWRRLARIHYILFVGVGFAAISVFSQLGQGAGVQEIIASLWFHPRFLILIIFLFLLIPLINAVLDWLSWMTTRWLLGRLQRNPGWLALGHIGLDALAAISFLLAIMWLLPAALTAANGLLIWLDWPTFHWRHLMDFVWNDPLGRGLMITGMLVTTLIPTALHLVAALTSLLLPNLSPEHRNDRWSRWCLNLITHPAPNNFHRFGIALWLGGTVFTSWILFLVAVAFIYALLASFGLEFGDLLKSIYGQFEPHGLRWHIKVLP